MWWSILSADIYMDIVKLWNQKGLLDLYYFINERENQIFKALTCIVQQNHPLNEIDKEISWEMLNFMLWNYPLCWIIYVNCTVMAFRRNIC